MEDDLLNQTIMDPLSNSGNPAMQNPPPNNNAAEANAALQQQLALMQSQIQLLVQKVQHVEAENAELKGQIQQTDQIQPPINLQFHTANYAPPATTFNPQSNMRKLLDLPLFNGQPEQWPVFLASFNQSTEAFGYTPLENLLRLQRALTGEAKDAVQCLLINPANVADVINSLEFRFGRTEALVHSQLQIVRQIQPISEHNLIAIMPFASKVQNLATFLNTPKTKQHLANPVLIDELVQKLPILKRIEWAQHSSSIEPYPTLLDLSKWIHDFARYVNMATMNTPSAAPTSYQIQPSTSSTQPNRGSRQRQSNRNVMLHSYEAKNVTANAIMPCAFCSKSGHTIPTCDGFRQLTVDDRWEEVKRQHLCFSCLKKGHGITLCHGRKFCGVNDCKKTHHNLLHEDTPVPANTDRPPNPFGKPANKTVLNCLAAPPQPELFFRIVPVKLSSATKEVETYALLDEGSSVTLLDEKIADELELVGETSNLELNWFGNRNTSEPSRNVHLKIKGMSEKSSYDMHNVRTVQNISLPAQTVNITDLHSRYRHLKRLPLTPMVRGTPKILIGLDHCHLGVAIETVSAEVGAPVAAKTKLGWVVFGPVASGRNNTSVVLHGHEKRQMDDLHEIVHDYFTTENFGVSVSEQPLQSESDQRALSILQSTTVRVEGNKFQTGLLWRSEDVHLPSSYTMAENRLASIERRMRRDPGFADEYEENLMSYVKKGYARRLTDKELRDSTDSKRVWYLPHLAVQNPNKPGKFRLVFDAAAMVNGVSLNSALLKGPDLNKTLLDTLFQIRFGTVGVCGDIKEMFHQVIIQPTDQPAQRLLWRHGDSRRQMEHYVMLSMTFGSSCSPCSAQFVKNKNAEEYRDTHPDAVDAIMNHHYVDDFVMSFPTTDRAIRTARDVIEVHKNGGFELRNFTSNCQDVLAAISSQPNKQTTPATNMQLDAKNSPKILGMYWETDSDSFMFQLKFVRVSPDIVDHSKVPSKREVLSLAMSIFDPFGLLANFTLHAKVLFQELWKTGLGWDDPIPESAFEKWSKWLDILPDVKKCRVPRCYSPKLLNSTDVQLHIFADASESAFAAVAYLRIRRTEEEFDIAFVMGKTKCAPSKLLSVPRLELQAAVLATRLLNSILSSHNFPISRTRLWTDSKTVVQWIHSDSRRYKPFVAHRIAEILDSTTMTQWQWLPTLDNVADDATRVSSPPILDPHSRWLTGPPFLKLSEENWPVSLDLQSETTEEIRKPFVQIIQKRLPLIELDRFSNLARLRRATAWVNRFVFNLKAHVVDPRTSRPNGELSVDELDAADTLLCKLAQQECFANEYDALQNDLLINRTSPIFNLSPYLSEEKVIRIKGRIDAAKNLPFETRRPIILPKKHRLTELVVDYFHKTLKHQNESTIICSIREKYWVPHIRTAVRQSARKCMTCRLRSAKPEAPKMGQLPIDRLEPYVRPFTYTGLDYFGPVFVTVGRRQEKRWVALFTCLTVRAVHLEIASDLSTDACILCLRNFINIRGAPKRIRSDNGTNFVGARHEWANSAHLLDQEAIQRELSTNQVEWIFNCPGNPSAGGCWERMVRSIKRVLEVTLHEAAPRVETLRSLLIEAANIINSRPLTHIPVDSTEQEPLTPNHFLIGPSMRNDHDPTTTHTEDRTNLCSRKQWRIAQQMMHSFWRRWVREYLPELTRRTKWYGDVAPLEEGNLVLICDENQPRSKWRRGIISEVNVDKEGRVRTAKVRTADGELRRPAIKLARIDITTENVSESLI